MQYSDAADYETPKRKRLLDVMGSDATDETMPESPVSSQTATTGTDYPPEAPPVEPPAEALAPANTGVTEPEAQVATATAAPVDAAAGNPQIDAYLAAIKNAGATGSVNTPASTGYQDALKTRLMQVLGQTPEDVTGSDTFKAQVNNYDAEAQRQLARTRSAIAERNAAQGTGDSGAMDAELLGATEKSGQDTTNFSATLAGQMLKDQQTQIMQALSTGGSWMTQEQQMALQDKLAQINAALQTNTLNENARQYNNTAGTNLSEWEWMQNLLPYLMGSGA